MGKDYQGDEYIKELRKTYKEKSNEELGVFRENYIPSEYTPEAKKIIEEVFKEREIDLESDISDKKEMESIRPDAHENKFGDNSVKIQGKYYEIAPLSKRFFAYIIDHYIIVIIFILIVGNSPTLRSFYPIYTVLIFLYWIFKDGIKNGKSLGKTIVKIQVIDSETGSPCDPIKSLMRNLSLIILSIIDIFFIFGAESQRLGDKIANTYVINERIK